MSKIKISNDIIIARIKGQNELTLCDGSSLFKVGGELKIYDLLTGKGYQLFGDVAEYLALGYFDSLKGFMGKHLDEESIMALYKQLRTNEFKNEFKLTYKKEAEGTQKLCEILDKCDDLYDLDM